MLRSVLRFIPLLDLLDLIEWFIAASIVCIILAVVIPTCHYHSFDNDEERCLAGMKSACVRWQAQEEIKALRDG